MSPTRLALKTIRRGMGIIALSCAAAFFADAAAADPVDFVREVQPILAAHCFECHGEDAQESSLRLDSGAAIVDGGNSGPAVVAGKSVESVLIKAIRGDDKEASKMPPEGPALSPDEIAVIARWIDEGAKAPDEPVTQAARRTSDHWSFRPIALVEPPAVKDQSWVRNPIDSFVLQRLDAAGLSPSPEADKATLIRRVTLDLLGLPPSAADVEAFLADTSGDAYERMVDRLLNSPHYGERWGRDWLDIARYADSNGYTIDGGRSIWKYRDWVIEAMNRDLPFDRFAVEQLAGDMLPEVRLDQIVATGFHRNTLVNEEGGTDQEQFRVEAVVDRVSTTGAAFLGLTVGCARCHDHKYDPISQREFYELFAIFNNCDEPTLPVPTDKQSKEMPALLAEIKQSEERLAMVDANSGGRQAEWEAALAGKLAVNWTVLDAAAQSSGGAAVALLGDNSLLVGGKVPSGDTYTVGAALPLQNATGLMLETLPHKGLPAKGPGLSPEGGFVLHELKIEFELADGTRKTAPVAGALSEYSPENGPIAHAIDGKPKTGWRVTDPANLSVPQSAVFVLAEPVPAEATRIVLTLEHREQKQPLQIGRFRVSLSTSEPKALTVPASVRVALATPSEKRDDAQRQAIREHYQTLDPERVPLAAQIAELKKRQKQIERATTTTLVMQEREELRTTHVHLRGDFLRPGAVVQPDVPEVLPRLVARGQRPDRLDFARWLVDDENPLTARVTVNRIWQRHFGQGLVTTENDFGTQGDPPTHPELLDWLARRFMAGGWSQKALHRLIVTSATYRQSSHAREDLAKADPYNKLLGRQQRLRLDAESIRDVALAASGMLSEEIGGPGVYPPQPEGIYRFTQQKKFWGESKGEDRYRRGMYTYLWRSSPYPFLKTFDAPDATVACTRRPRSNTPLQALTLANDRAFFEIAQGFAAELLAAPADSDETRLRLGFRRALARDPAAEELSALSQYLQSERGRFVDGAKEAGEVASKRRPNGVDDATAAAWTMVARVLLNLDEFITRE